MKLYKPFLFLIIILSIAGIIAGAANGHDERFISYTAEPESLSMFHKNKAGKNFGSIENLKQWLLGKNKKLSFAMNGGMYKPDHTPQGLYIENGRLLSPLDTLSGNGNFYLKPNGVFYITTKNRADICKTPDFKNGNTLKYATQSGPMLISRGQMHPAFKRGSANLQIRNGVGILPDGNVHFAMSKEPINFYDFAAYFKNMGCKNALYLDGFVSRTYLPEENWLQTDGNFGVIIAVTQ
ncbi:phosphodiester glycosidase family protein [Flavobacterium sp. DGU11]|uniref:Phosphodiester glycosidase family protein n=1 Tax=Flavobacterium arundinis TaxID=3139143 RepID=A0ABU9HRT7_9FLAO